MTPVWHHLCFAVVGVVIAEAPGKSKNLLSVVWPAESYPYEIVVTCREFWGAPCGLMRSIIPGQSRRPRWTGVVPRIGGMES